MSSQASLPRFRTCTAERLYLSGGAAHERHSVPHFHGNRHGGQVSLPHQRRLRLQGELGLTGQRGRQELGSTAVAHRHVFLAERGQKTGGESVTSKAERLPLGAAHLLVAATVFRLGGVRQVDARSAVNHAVAAVAGFYYFHQSFINGAHRVHAYDKEEHKRRDVDRILQTISPTLFSIDF